MNAAIVDTDVVSMLFKGDTRARAYRPHVTGRLLGISFMTLAELERWSLERLGPETEARTSPTPDPVCRAAGQPRIVWQMGRGFLRREEKRTSDPNGRRLDCSERPPLSGSLITNNRGDYSVVDGLVPLSA